MTSFADARYLSVSGAAADVRAAFVRRTYAHLAAAIGAFVLIEIVLLKSGLAGPMLRLIGSSRFGWLMVLGGFIVTGWLARGLASSGASVAAQYSGLALYVVAEAVIFVPMLYLAAHYSAPDVIPMAGVLTGTLFLGLTLVVFTTRKDFSFLAGILQIGGCIALGMIVCAAIFGFGLGLLFSTAMVGLACAAILYDTSKILLHYPTDRHVAAALELFASVALLFWYILRILMARRR